VHKSGRQHTRFQYGFLFLRPSWCSCVSLPPVTPGHVKKSQKSSRGAVLHGKAIIKKKCECLEMCSYYNYYLATLFINFY